ncbi:hypothetical protein GUJ93_ZPchr0011g27657 [Zizania palustris]|uniref:Uncharacterized protein n=1 Tax=Zizania palustris TaxID=103762 RepID=A0A8J5WIM2_ZIZPA|nr:hypothetical protein GUJ93_ZPchr0011g27657 [Zizania palustris]
MATDSVPPHLVLCPPPGHRMPPHLALRSPPRLPVTSPSLFVSLSDRIPSADDAYFMLEVIACRDGSVSFPKSRLNDAYQVSHYLDLYSRFG